MKKFFAAILLVPLVRSETNTTESETDTYQSATYMSLLFYEAQRSGRLPENNRIPWRGDSAVGDRGQNGEDLSGGYYDASDYVKFGFTTAWTTTILAWGGIVYPEGYKFAGQMENLLAAIKWSTDYFVKCHVDKNELYGQVGDFDIDVKFWGRPEDMNMSRPAYKIDESHPGSDLSAEVSAALASSSVIFRDVKKTYSSELLRHSVELFEFADNYRGSYQNAIPGAKNFYGRNQGYGDELTWASLWLYKATGDEKYLKRALDFYATYQLQGRPDRFYYNNKMAGIQLLLAQITGDAAHLASVEAFCEHFSTNQTRTPQGLIFVEKLGALGHAANVAFLCLQVYDLDLGPKYLDFSKEQIDLILGKGSNWSYVVGFGPNFPKRPHHLASSCPNRPANCGEDERKSSEPNPQLLRGALVSGPDVSGYYRDIREEYLFNEVTLDYNAGFQSVLAGLLQKGLVFAKT